MFLFFVFFVLFFAGWLGMVQYVKWFSFVGVELWYCTVHLLFDVLLYAEDDTSDVYYMCLDLRPFLLDIVGADVFYF